MKKKRSLTKGLFNLIFLILLVSMPVYFFQFNSFGYALTVPLRGYTKATDNVYIDKNFKSDRDTVLEILETAENRVTQFWGSIEDQPEIIISDDENTLRRLGWTGSPALTTTAVLFGAHNYILISPDGLNVDVLAHELTHAELHYRLYRGKILSAALIPVWFDEGVATQNDYRSDYSDASWKDATDGGKNVTDFAALKTPKEFYNPDINVRRYNYIISKHEVGIWMKSHKIDDLIRLADAINAGETFDSQYYG